MRLVTWINAADAKVGARLPGVVIADSAGVDRLLDLSSHFAPGTDLVDLLGDETALALINRLADEAEPIELPLLADIPLAPPVVPSKILCLGYNYRWHVAAGADLDETPPHPNVFVKTPNTLAGPCDDVVLPPVSEHTDYEGEIAIVISRTAKNVPLESAGKHIGGYTLLNDVSSRDWQDRATQWELGKCFDGFAPLGPWVITADAVPDPMNLTLEVVRDGQVTVSQGTDTMVFTMEYLVHYISQAMTLNPGDVISSGTPQKLASGQASHKPLAHGDAVTIRVAGIGELTTRFVDPT